MAIDHKTRYTNKYMANTLVSGIKPSGSLHLGNYHGAVKQWVSLSDCTMFFMIADYHALTSPQVVDKTAKYDMACDLIALGVNPECLFYQSDVPEHTELCLLLSMITPLKWLERTPSFKDQLDKRSPDWITHGFLGYPLLMAADILLYRATHVPVGTDQLPHIELTREIARRFNHVYQTDLFPMPQPILNNTPVFVGTDGEKMSKSRDNILPVMGSESDTLDRIKQMKTHRLRRNDPGIPEKCSVFSYHKVYNPDFLSIKVACETAAIGCVDCKLTCAQAINTALAPARKTRATLSHSGLDAGAKRARLHAQETLTQVKDIMKL